MSYNIYYRFRSNIKEPVYFNKAGLERELTNLLADSVKEAAKEIVHRVKVAIRYWSEESKPDYRTSTRISSSSIIVKVDIQGKIFKFITHGTSIRYATMTKGFISKSTPNSLVGRRGKGGLWFVSKDYKRDGIEPRNFEETASEEVWPSFRKEARIVYMNTFTKYYRRAIGISKQMATKRSKGIIS